MKNFPNTTPSIDDFSNKCRICLNNYSDMIDIFASGISDQVMEVINIKIASNDKLPKSMCLECNKQIDEFHKFQNLAKDSDNYLRALLVAEQNHTRDIENHLQKKKRKVHMRKKMNSSQDLANEKMYLILVPEEFGSQNEIEIKDVGNENVELTDFCRSLIQKESDDAGLRDITELSVTGSSIDHEGDGKRIYTVGVMIYQCSECDECFEFKDLLIEHGLSCHKSSVMCSQFEYSCPVCSLSETNRILFMDHLKKHKNEGFTFLKVDKNGKDIPLNVLDEEIFEAPKFVEKSNVSHKVYKINIDCYRCLSCKTLEPECSINDHLRTCYPGFSDEDYERPHLKYACPACSDIWIDDLKSFNLHLLNHRSEYIFFVKVDSSGNPVDVDEVPFTTFQKALSLLPFGCESDKRVVKMRGLYSCLACGFEAGTGSGLSEHCLLLHGNVAIPSELTCPACYEKFKCTDAEDRIKYRTHMKGHKDEGVCFIKIDAKDNVLNDDDSNLFCNVQDLFRGEIKCPEMEFITNIYVPEVFMVDKVEDVRRANRDYVCEKCGKKCFGKGNYKRHFLTHSERTHAQKRPKCSVCGKAFSSRAAVNEHRKYHGNIGGENAVTMTICEVCGRRLSNNASLAKHRRLHETERENLLLKCKICERGFRKESSLNRHVSAHLNPNYFECEECKLPLPSSASLQRHRLSHQASSSTFDCKVCKVSFLTKDRLNAHQIHTGHHQDRKRFECNVCHEMFFVGREFSRHIKLHPKYKMSECTLCGKRLSTVQSLMLHLSRHFESNSILCPHCGRQFFEERNYHRHLLTHNGVKPFSCDVENCKKSFYTYFELNRHKKYHNNTRDFSCPYCPKSFHEANHLKVHIRTHTGERPYTCPHCRKGFVTRTRCKQHINLIHQGVGCDLIQSSISKKVAVFEAFEAAS